MAVTLSRNLKLRIDSNLTANARYNLEKLDLLGSTFLVDTTDTLNIRSATDIVIEPESADIGGSGAGGTVSIGTPSHDIDTLAVYATNFDLSTNLGLADQATGGNKSLRVRYKSDLNGSVDTVANRLLSVDVDGADRNLVLGGSLALTGGDLTLNLSGTTSLILPQTGTLSTLAGSELLTNKSIDASSNTLTNIANSAISASAAIAYSKLNLTGSIVNADISPSAAIVYSKLSIANSILNADINSAAAIARTKLASGSANHVVVNDGSGVLSSEAALAASRGGTGVSGSAVFPASGTVATDTNSLTLTNKSISGSTNTLSNISYSSLVLTGSIINADISSSAAISYSKLNLNASIVNSDVSGSAAIAYSKLTLTGSVVNADISNSAAISYSKLALTNSVVNADIAAAAAISGSKINPDFGNQVIKTLDRLRFEEGGYTTDLRAAQSGQSANLDFRLPPSAGINGQVLITNGSGEMDWATVSGSGTVTSVALAAPAEFTVTGSPVTTAGTLTLSWANETANTVLAGPTGGGATTPSFRLLVKADLPLASLTTDDIAEGASNLYFTNERAQDAVGNILADSSKIDFTYNDAGNSITATIVAGSLADVDINASAAIALTKLAALTNHNRALVSDNSGFITESAVTSTELGYVSGVTSAIQTQINGKQPLDATLTALAAYNTNGFVVQTAPDTFAGRTLTAGTGISITDGDGVAGNPSISSTITQYTDEQAQDAVGTILTDTASVDFTYNDAGNTISAVVLPGGVDHNSLANLTTGDAHTQYAKLTGRAGGQTLQGGTLAGNNLVLQSTANATKGKTFIGPAIDPVLTVDEVNEFVGIGTDTPTANLHVIGSTRLADLSTGVVHASATGVLSSSAVVLTTEVSGVLPVANGGTNSSTALNNNRVMKSSGGAIVEAAAITAARALISDANGIPTQSVTTSAELAFVSGVTSAIQTQIDGKVSLTGNEVISGIKTFNNTPLLKTALDIEDPGAGTGKITVAAPTGLTSWSLTLPPDDGTLGQFLTTDGNGVTTWTTATGVQSFKEDWTSGTTHTTTHNLGTRDVQITLYDNTTFETIKVDSEIRTTTNAVDFTASQAPTGAGWRVLITKVP